MDSPFMDIRGDQENKDLLTQAFRAFMTGKPEVEHLGRKWKTRMLGGKRVFEIPSYFQTMIRVTQPDEKGRCKVKIDLPHLVHEDGCQTMNGMVVQNTGGEASSFLFRSRGESQVRIEMAKRLLATRKITKEDLKPILNEWELSNV